MPTGIEISSFEFKIVVFTTNTKYGNRHTDGKINRLRDLFSLRASTSSQTGRLFQISLHVEFGSVFCELKELTLLPDGSNVEFERLSVGFQ